MKQMKRTVHILTALLLTILAVSIIVVAHRNDKDKFDLCREDVTAHAKALERDIEKIEGLLTNSSNEHYRYYKNLFTLDLLMIDATKHDEIVFSFKNNNAEMSISVVYSKNDEITIANDYHVSKDNPILRVEQLGVNQKGYIRCKRMMEHWYYLELYIPT